MPKLDDELNWLSERTAANTIRLYFEDHETVRAIKLELRYRPVSTQETDVAPEWQLFRCAMGPDVAEKIADQLLAAVRQARRKDEIGDH